MKFNVRIFTNLLLGILLLGAYGPKETPAATTEPQAQPSGPQPGAGMGWVDGSSGNHTLHFYVRVAT